MGNNDNSNTNGRCVIKDNMGIFGIGNIRVYDLTDLTDPILLTELYEYAPRGISKEGTILYTTDTDKGFVSFVITNPQNPWEIASLQMDNLRQFVNKGGFSYISTVYDGITVLDKSNPFNPVLYSNLDTYGYTLSVKIEDNYAYACDESGALVIIKLWDK